MFPKKGNQIGNYQLMFEIGSGGYASVWRAVHVKTSVEVAVKIIEKCTLKEESIVRLKREISLQRRLNHPFIASLYDVLETPDFYFIIIELAEKGNFLDYINGMGKVPEDLAKHYFVQLIYVLEYLHLGQNIAHRDIKCENILLDKYSNIKLIDFGLCHDFSPENNLMITPCGSPPYAAPEIIKGQMYTEATDIWSAGIFLYAMVCGHLPFEGSTNSVLIQRILYNDPCFAEEMSNEIVDMISRLLTKNETKRISTKEIKQHPWFLKREYDILCSFTWNSHFDVNKIDEEVFAEMAKSGAYDAFDQEGLLDCLQKREMSDLTAAYRMLHKIKINRIWGATHNGCSMGNDFLQKTLNLPPVFRSIPHRIPSSMQKEKENSNNLNSNLNSNNLNLNPNTGFRSLNSNNQRVVIFAPKVTSQLPSQNPACKEVLKTAYPKAQSNLLIACKRTINGQRRMSKPLINRPTILHV